jgi:small subunit ribosomal protein S15
VAPEWSGAKKAEVKEIILKMAKEGAPPTKIGLALRDQHAIPNAKAVLGMGVISFLKQENALPEFPDDLMNLIKKAVRMQEHLKTRRDIHNQVKLRHVESKIGRLVKYYAAKKRIPVGWRYDAEKAALLVK